MKNIYKLLAVFVTGSILFSSCREVEKATFKDTDAYFAFETDKSSMIENDVSTLRIPVSLAKSSGVGEVTFDIVTEGFDNPAVEGEDFTVKTSNRTVAFEGDFVKSIEIKLIDNYVRDGDKKFKLILKDNNIGATIGMANKAKTEHEITISDNEHPLAALIGVDFQATEQSIAEDTDGNQIAPYILPIEIRGDTVPGRDDRLLIKGLLGVNQEVRVELNMETGEVIMEDQKFYDVIDPYFGIPIELTFYGWEWFVTEDGKDGIKRYLQAIGTFDLDKQEIVFDSGYLTQITGPSTHPYVGKAYHILIVEHCRIGKKN
ncbi:MAG: hypothetical protein MI866_11015 [Bacteroidales bacterium]|nr:hypothetical protein [Bacteroidales bacterium]